MSKLRLTLACWNYDRTRALAEGRIQPDGIELNYLSLPVEETFFRMLRHREFDVAEMSLSSYTILRSEGDTRFIAIPVFPSRVFRQNALYVRADSPLRDPRELKGKRIGRVAISSQRRVAYSFRKRVATMRLDGSHRREIYNTFTRQPLTAMCMGTEFWRNKYAGLAERAQVQVAYAIGVAHPVSVMIETFGTEKVGRAKIAELVDSHFDLRPGAFRETLKLHRPIYQKTAAYGHFGRDDHDFTWERTDKAEALREAAGLGAGAAA